jgi:hypothetical protein
MEVSKKIQERRLQYKHMFRERMRVTLGNSSERETKEEVEKL